MVVIWVLMLAFKGIFQINNKDALYGEACVNNLYGDVNNYLYSAITSKAITSGDTKIYPNIYYIEFDTTTNAIYMGYTTGDASSPIIMNTYIPLTGAPQNYNCTSNGYNMRLSGEHLQIKINKWLIEDANWKSMSLSWIGIGNDTFTSDVKLLLTYPWGTWYKELGRFEIDIRTQSIKKKLCLLINNTWDCSSRNQ